MAGGRREEQREATRIVRERLRIAGQRARDRAARRAREIDVQDVLGAEVLAAAQPSRENVLPRP